MNEQQELSRILGLTEKIASWAEIFVEIGKLQERAKNCCKTTEEILLEEFKGETLLQPLQKNNHD